jgi:nucleolar complex protein 2
MKKLYNEFARECKIGGGGLNVQERLRITQNCFVELLDYDMSIGYQLGFSYIRQLCMHLRTIRNSLNQDALKGIYSW